MDWTQATINDLDMALGILCAWREADNQGNMGMRAVLHVIENRSRKSNKSWAQIVFAKAQFTSMTVPVNDPDFYRVPLAGDTAYAYLKSIVNDVYLGNDEDITLGATNYYANTIPPPYWVASMTFTVQIGTQLFYK